MGVTARDNRNFVNGVLCSGAQRKDLPVVSGLESEKRLQVLPVDPDNSYVMIDSTIVRAHQQAICDKGAKKKIWGVLAAD